MAPRDTLGAHFGLFWALVAKCVPERLWDVILVCFGLCWPNGSQRGSGSSFWLVPGAGIDVISLHVSGWACRSDFVAI